MSIVYSVRNNVRDRLGTSAMTHGDASSPFFFTAVILMLYPTIDTNIDAAVVFNIVIVVVIFLLAVIVAI